MNCCCITNLGSEGLKLTYETHPLKLITNIVFIIYLGAGIPTHIQCPHITEQDLHQTVVCGNQSCPTYSWEMGPWQSCILHNHKRENGQYVCRDLYCWQ